MNIAPILQLANENVSCGLLIGHSAQMLQVFDLIRIAASSRCSVLIVGETGTGKELVARSIHALGACSNKPFVPVDCPSLPPTLIESELFGHVRGAFTGATTSKVGLFQSAGAGTLFLDEIGDLPIQLQVRLLRATESHEIRPIGSTNVIPFSARILAATNRDLRSAVREGDFREDLYYRLDVLSIGLPPLRERRIDIPIIAEQLIRSLRGQPGQARPSDPSPLSSNALDLLCRHDWPGNVRELRNCLERALLLGSGFRIEGCDISFNPEIATAVSRGGPIGTLSTLEQEIIIRTISFTGGDVAGAAKLLGIGKTTIYRKLQKYRVLAELLPPL